MVALTEGFRYDLWANRIWLSHLGAFKNMNRPLEILEHIHGAQVIWLIRCGVEFGDSKKDMSLADLFADSTEIWIQFLKDRELDEPLTYNREGVDYTHTLGEIAMHVINHGTYHRGHLRGLAEGDGYIDFPDTDFALYLRERQ